MADDSIQGMAARINALMTEYTAEVTERIDSAGREVADEMLSRVREKSPVRTGKYRGGWAVKRRETAGKISYFVHNAKFPGLTHLLEYGHAKRGGGRTAARPHIRPVEQWGREEYEKRVKEAVDDAGKS